MPVNFPKEFLAVVQNKAKRWHQLSQEGKAVSRELISIITKGNEAMNATTVTE